MAPSDDSEPRPRNDREPPEQARAVIALPYSLSNMVFIEAAPLWLCLILGIVGLIVGGLRLLAGAGSHEIVFASAACVLIGAVGLLVLWHALWRWAVEGRLAATIVLYVSYLLGVICGPLLVLPIVAFAVPLPILAADGARDAGWLTIALAGLVLIVLGLAWILALANLFERRLWEFARLNGLCPLCRQWRFGRIRRPGSVACGHCGVIIEFVRDDQQQRSSGR